PQTTSFLSGATQACHSGIQLSAQTDDQQAFDYVHLIANALATEAADTMTPIPQFTVCLHLEPPKDPGLYAEAVLYSPGYSYQPGGCEINVYNTKFEGLSGNTPAGILAHEAFHCFQERLAETVDTFNSVSRWIKEGEATWVMEELWPGSSAPLAPWPTYAESPLVNYANRDYDGMGVFGHEGDVEGDQSKVWLQLLQVFAAGEHHQDATALGVLMGGLSNRYFSSWGASYFEDQPHADWHMGGPGPLPIQAPPPQSVTIANGDNEFIGNVGPYLAQYVKISGTPDNPDILTVTLASGYGELHDEGYGVEQTLSDVAPVALCLRVGGCKCPDGSPGASEVTIPAKGPVYVGMDGGSFSLVAAASGESLDKYCQKPDPPLPPGPPSAPPSPPAGEGGGGGGETETPAPPAGHSWGDPHLITFNGQTFDMQAAGEFTLVKSTVDDLLIQTRTVPLPGPHPVVAVNEAVAARVSGHRVTLQLENGLLVVRIDGVVDSYEETSAGTGTVQRLGTEAGAAYLVEWPDGTTMTVDQMGSVGLDVTITPSAARAAKLVGLLGTDGGTSSGDLVTSDGTDLGSSPSAQTIDGQYADSWRLTQADSLFDYAPGQTTVTFTDLSFPSSYVDSTTIQGASQATQECEADGISEPQLLADCVVDASSSPDHAVLTHYAQAQLVTTVEYDLAHNLPPGAPVSPSTAQPGGTPTAGASAPPGSNPQGTLIDTGNLGDPSEEQTFSFTANAGAVIWIGEPLACDPGDIMMTLTDPLGKTLIPDEDAGFSDSSAPDQQFPPCFQGDRFTATTTGTYQLTANVDHQESGTYSVPITFERGDVVRQAAYGQTLSGDIPDFGSHDVYTFTADGGDLVQIKGPGCSFTPGSAGNEGTGVGDVLIFDTAGHRLGSMDCGTEGNTGWWQIPPTGSTPFPGVAGTPVPAVATYELVVNGQD
ncbi:MAG: VWD domain-containing protein, partial [Candidatus Dormiibacterota bacterium]